MNLTNYYSKNKPFCGGKRKRKGVRKKAPDPFSSHLTSVYAWRYNCIISMDIKIFENAFSFDWDKGNQGKNFVKHKVTDEECEEVFFDPYKKVYNDILHSGGETRYLLVGRTKSERLLFVVFTFRRDRLRVISARGLNKKERKLLAT